MSQPTIRLLTAQNGTEYQRLRLESLQVNPEAFLSSYDTESKLHDSAFVDHLDWAYHPPAYGYFGIFIEEQLVGYLQASKNYLEKQDHIASLHNLYISKAHRHQGLASQLIEHVTQLLREKAGVERVFLSCTAKNQVAYKLYRKHGFHRIGVKARAIKWNDQYDDEVEMVKLLVMGP
ncbi:GNAT family N-acetyltransferase [Patescibacteria group bacterium]|nr:GNAT family N-acetyltransferase [Patescibacteria group bacterium]